MNAFIIKEYITMSRNNNMQKLKSFYDLKDLLWNLYPAYVLYNKYTDQYYVSSIQQFDKLKTVYPYIILSEFNDNPIYNELSYEDYCLAYTVIQCDLIQYLQDAIILRNKEVKFAEGV